MTSINRLWQRTVMVYIVHLIFFQVSLTVLFHPGLVVNSFPSVSRCRSEYFPFLECTRHLPSTTPAAATAPVFFLILGQCQRSSGKRQLDGFWRFVDGFQGGAECEDRIPAPVPVSRPFVPQGFWSSLAVSSLHDPSVCPFQ